MYKQMLSILLALLLLALCACTPKQAAPAPEETPAVEAEPAPTPEQPSEPEPAEAAEPEAEEPAPEPLKLDAGQADLGIASGSYALRNDRGQYLFQKSGMLGLRDTPYLWYFDNQGDGSFLIQDAWSRTVMLDINNAWYDPGNRVTAFAYTGDPAQLWQLTARDDTSFWIDSFAEPSLRLSLFSGWFLLGRTEDADENNVWTLWRDGDEPAPDAFVSDAPEAQPEYAPDDILARWDEDAMSAGKSYDKYAQYLSCDAYLGGDLDIYTIDFRTDDAPLYTYYALCDFWMTLDGLYAQPDFAELPDTEMNTVAGGAYAGLQTHESGPAAIMSFWHTEYIDTDGQRHLIEAKRLYPAGGETNQFGGEGTGTNYFTNIGWEPSHWYRMVIRCWDDPDTGSTLVGQWLCDLESGEWTLISCFDTGLPDSALAGIGQFLENWMPETNDQVRSWKLKNLYGREKQTARWHSLNAETMQAYDFGAQTGGYEYGVRDNCFWGKTCGVGRDMKQGVTADELAHVFRIAQPDEPELPAPAEPSLTLTAGAGTLHAEWSLDGSAPQCTACLELLDGSGAVAASLAIPRPEARAAELDGLAAGTYTVRLTVTDLWGQESITEQSIVIS